MGFDNLCKRIREGQKCCKEVEDFFRKNFDRDLREYLGIKINRTLRHVEWAKAQQQYSKSLKGLIRSTDEKDEIGDLGRSWSGVKEQTEMTSRLYEQSAAEYIRLAEELAKFNDSSKSVTKHVEDRVKERQKIKKNHHNKMTECKSSYFEKCREMMLCENQYESASRCVTSNQKESEKLKVKYDKSRDAMEKADVLYKQSLDVLEQARSVWESEMEEACNVFQQNEEDRIYTLRDNLWKSSNIDSQLCVDWDQSCETVRLYLERCDVKTDMDGYIRHSMTGSSRPSPILYENYFTDKSSSKGQNRSARNQPLPPIPVDNNSGGHYSYTDIASLPKKW